ncbi:hypothetical protein BH09MYX1_BH09MYX1_40590 [soil metagenome]
MANPSAYLKYLPPVLSEGDPAALEGMLRVFEKILSGTADGVTVYGDHVHPGVEEVVVALPRLFDPWLAPAEFLPWLASWVAVELDDGWTDHQRRRVIAHAVQTHARRGTRRGLMDALSLYAPSAQRPRVVVDEGSRLFFSPINGRSPAPVHSLVSQVLGTDLPFSAGLNSVLSIAPAPDGSLFVVDERVIFFGNLNQYRLFHLSRTGEYLSASKLTAAGPGPVAVAVDHQTPYGVWVITNESNPALSTLYRYSSPAAPPQSAATVADLGVGTPIALCFDHGDAAKLFILDQDATGKARILEVWLDYGSVKHTAVATHPLHSVVQPLSMIIASDGSLIIGDGGDQKAAKPGSIVRITRGVTWVEELLTPDGSANPLVSPVSILEDTTGQLLVLDNGMRPYQAEVDIAWVLSDPKYNPFVRRVSEQPMVYRVTLGGAPTFTPAIADQVLVIPSALAKVGDTLYIGDRGLDTFRLLAAVAKLAVSGEGFFGARLVLTVHFSDQRPTTYSERLAYIASVRRVVDRETPAHATVEILSMATDSSGGIPTPNGTVGGWSALGKTEQFLGNVIPMRNADGRIEVFVCGTDNALWHNWQLTPGGDWSGWVSFPTAVKLQSGDIAVVANSDGRLAAFVVATDGKVWHAWQGSPNGGWTGWTSLGGTPAMQNPALVAGRNLDGRLELLMHGTDNTVWHIAQTSAGGGWGAWSSIGGILAGSSTQMALGTNLDGRLELFVNGPPNDVMGSTSYALYHSWQITAGGTWSAFARRDGTNLATSSSIAVASNQDGRMEVFVRGYDNALWHVWQLHPNNGWGAIESLGGGNIVQSVNSDIAATTRPDGRITVVVIGSGKLYELTQTSAGSTTYSAWTNLEGSAESDVGITANLDGRLEVFMLGFANFMTHRWQSVANGPWA